MLCHSPPAPPRRTRAPRVRTHAHKCSPPAPFLARFVPTFCPPPSCPEEAEVEFLVDLALDTADAARIAEAERRSCAPPAPAAKQ